MVKKFLLIPLIIICALSFSLSGCGEKTEPPKKGERVTKKTIPKPKKVAAPKERASEKTSPAAGQPAAAASQASRENSADTAIELYNPVGKIDPFEPLLREKQVVAVVKKGGKKERRRTPLTPLEKVDISQLKLLGVILAPSGNRAMLSGSEGQLERSQFSHCHYHSFHKYCGQPKVSLTPADKEQPPAPGLHAL